MVGNRVLRAVALLGIAVASGGCPYVVYVDKDAPGPVHDGTTWTTAWPTVQEGIDYAVSLGPASFRTAQVWIAEGNYDEVRTTAENPSGALIMEPNVLLYGGFEGGETAVSQRDIAAHPSVIDGANGRGTGLPAWHVVSGDTSIWMDGCTIRNGAATGTSPDDRGGGVYCPSGQLTLRSCTVESNSASSGGGVYAENATAIAVQGCTIAGNTAVDKGGGVCSVGGSDPLMNDDIFDQNAAGTGGAVYCEGASPVLSGCTFTGNTANGGGALATPNRAS